MSLLQSFRAYCNFSGFALNDSQVATHRVWFYPEAASKLNPAQKPFEATRLGIMAAHHWDLALKVVTKLKTQDAL